MREPHRAHASTGAPGAAQPPSAKPPDKSHLQYVMGTAGREPPNTRV